MLNKTTPKPCFKAMLKNDGTLEMCVYEQLGKSWDGTGVTVADMKQQIDEAGPYNRILVRINSPGGDAFEGLACYNILRSQGKPVEVVVDGIAASAASIVAMAGDVRKMAHNSILMIHDAWSLCAGNASDMRKTADTLDTVSKAIAQTFVDRTGNSMDTIATMMNNETWMSAEDSIKNGFATAITPDEETGEAMALARSFKSLQGLRNVPAVLKNEPTEPDPGSDFPCACDCHNCTSEPQNCSDCLNDSCKDSNCQQCPFQDDGDGTPEDSNLSQFEARLRLLTLAR